MLPTQGDSIFLTSGRSRFKLNAGAWPKPSCATPCGVLAAPPRLEVPAVAETRAATTGLALGGRARASRELILDPDEAFIDR